MKVDESRPGDLRLVDQLARRQRVEDRLRELPRVAARRLGELQRDVGGEIAVRGVAGALDVDDGSDDVGGQDVGGQGGERGLDELFDAVFHADESISYPKSIASTSMDQRTRRASGSVSSAGNHVLMNFCSGECVAAWSSTCAR
jgi:hypothetical protein